MNANYKRNFAFLWSVALCIVLSPATVQPARADTSAPVSIRIALVSPPMISLGEPIMLRYRITNTSDQKIAERLGSRLNEWYSLSLIDDGNSAATRPLETALPKSPGLRPEPTGILPSGGTSAGYIVATQSLVVPRPGKYALHVDVHLPIAAAGGLSEGAAEDFIAAHGQTWTQECSFPITVGPADRNRLRATDEALRKAVAGEKNVVIREADAEALFSMPEAEALLSWQALASGIATPTDLRSIAITQLVRKHSIGTADALAEIAWGEAPSGDEAAHLQARSGLARMYDTGDAVLQQHIQGLYASHGDKLPEYSIHNDN